LVKDSKAKLDLRLYNRLIGDPCYKYNRYSKEQFFKNKLATYLYLRLLPILKEKGRKLDKVIIDELSELAY
jgi:ribonuclease HIII